MKKPHSEKSVAVHAKAASFLLALVLCIFGDASAYAEPRALASVLELGAEPAPSQPWPVGLRMVLYDDGQVLARSRPYTSDAEGEVVTGFYSRTEAARIVNELRESLVDVPSTLNTEPKMATQKAGTTILQLWDEGRQEYVQWWAARHPCLWASQSQLDTLSSQIRDRLDGRFIRACDSLTQIRLPEAKPWKPDEIRIELYPTGPGADVTHPWPDDWFEEQPRYPNILYACAVSRSARSALTQRIRSIASRGGTIGEHVKSADGTSWTISALLYPLPGPISYQLGGGDNLITGTIPSPCALKSGISP